VSKRSSTSRSSKPATPSRTQRVEVNRRPLVVFVTLVVFLTGTSALLLALSRPPLPADMLYAVESTGGIDSIFQTQTPATANQWRYIYIHHSRTPDGNSHTLAQAPAGLADHFVITNGQGGLDGQIEVSQRWHQQQPGLYINEGCVSICLIGDFDRALPSNNQVQQLSKLVIALQTKLAIPAQNVIIRDDAASPAGIGQYFPTTAVRSQLVK
jgi:hypothetical protein